MAKEIDHEYTDNCVCPYCGYVDKDSWELGEDGETTCGSCGEEFEFTRNLSVTYSTSKRKCETCDYCFVRAWEHTKKPGTYLAISNCNICNHRSSTEISHEQYLLLTK